MTTEATYFMLKAEEATGEPPPREDDQLIPFLRRMQAVLGPGSPEAWRGVFMYLGEYHQGMDRFNILWALLTFCKSVAAIRRWARTWMLALPSADIHPISMVLCSATLPIRLQGPILAIYRRNFPGRTNPMVQEMVKSTIRPNDVGCWSWTVILPPHYPVEGLVSTLPVTVREAVYGSINSIGARWCLRELAVCGFSRLTTIGPGLVVQSNLGLYLCPAKVEIQHGTLIGGSAWVAPTEFDWGAARIKDPSLGDWRGNVGWEEADEPFGADAAGEQIGVHPAEDPICFPSTWLRMFYGYWIRPAKGGP